MTDIHKLLSIIFARDYLMVHCLDTRTAHHDPALSS